MEIIVTMFGAAFLVLGVYFLVVLLGALLGAFTGWVVGLFFADTILGIFAQIGIKGFAMWQLGLFLGFVGGFFKSVSTTKLK